MMLLLANAEPTDLSESQLPVILACLLVIVVAAAMTVIPIAIATRRSHRRMDVVIAAALAWGLAAAASVIYFWLAEIQWSQEYQRMIKTGYFDPQDTSGAPAYPWQQWIVLAAVFVGLIAYTMFRKRPPAASTR